ncbi:MAG TPA: ABC transporter ATP-binding protein, partial [Thermoanaerobaculia bacterium]|nr:ABC transporter ATP-binding protein [Thermoanaerobaculia bacterium]
LTRRFGDFTAVAGIDLRVPEGSFFGFLGPNGAGKSTTIKCLTGLLRPSAGRMAILGRDPLAEPIEVKRRVGVVPEDLALFPRLTGWENLSFVGRVHGMAPQVLEERAEELLELMQLADAASVLVADYSHGMKKKLALALAFLPSPRLLFLDEPFEGIDAVSSRQIKSLLQAYAGRGGTIFLTSHVMEIVERLADHVGIIHRGELVAQGPIADLHGERGETRNLEDLFLEVVGAEGAAGPRLEWLGG